MKRLPRSVVLVLVGLAVMASNAVATSQRSFVSAQLGNDANACGPTAPAKAGPAASSSAPARVPCAAMATVARATPRQIPR